MLKKLILNGKQIPVPVPIQNMQNALDWIEDALLNNGQVITKAYLNENPFFVDELDHGQLKRSLGPRDKLELRVDSPYHLLIQMIEALHGLSNLVAQSIKHVAVDCWGEIPGKSIQSLTEIVSDFESLLQLLDNLDGFVGRDQVDVAPVLGQGVMIRSYYEQLKSHYEQKQYKECARVLLNKLEPEVKSFSHEVENLHVRALCSKP